MAPTTEPANARSTGRPRRLQRRSLTRPSQQRRNCGRFLTAVWIGKQSALRGAARRVRQDALPR
eukprot:3920158-Pyramimonas_sp.AAC.1